MCNCPSPSPIECICHTQYWQAKTPSTQIGSHYRSRVKIQIFLFWVILISHCCQLKSTPSYNVIPVHFIPVPPETRFITSPSSVPSFALPIKDKYTHSQTYIYTHASIVPSSCTQCCLMRALTFLWIKTVGCVSSPASFPSGEKKKKKAPHSVFQNIPSKVDT